MDNKKATDIKNGNPLVKERYAEISQESQGVVGVQVEQRSAIKLLRPTDLMSSGNSGMPCGLRSNHLRAAIIASAKSLDAQALRRLADFVQALKEPHSAPHLSDDLGQGQQARQ